MSLTHTAIRNAKPKDKPYKLADGGGLYLEVSPRGGKWWRLKYRYAGKEKRLSFGVYPEVSLADGREKRDQAKRLLKAGTDPSLVRKQAKAANLLDAQNTFRAVALEWHEQQRERWIPDHVRRVMESLERDVFTYLGDRPIADITPQDVLSVIRGVEKRGALDVASRVLQRTGGVFRYAVQTGRIKSNPATELRGTLKTRKVAHRPALKEGELPEFLRKLDAYNGDIVTALGLRLLMLTFVRPGELRGARWAEFNIERAEWRIPAERMKMRHEHMVPLSRQALDVLVKLRPITGNHELLFPNRNGGKRPMSENTLTYAMYRMGYHSRATAHGFRATASTILNEHGFRADVIERQLAHVERNKVRAAYHRSEYLKERREMMQQWADYLDKLKAGAEVIPLYQNA